MKKRLSPVAHSSGNGIKLKKIGIGSAAFFAVGTAAVCIGFGILNNSEQDTSATDGGIISLSDSMVINPAYEEYLADVASGNGEKWELIPNKYISATQDSGFRMYGTDGGASNLPASYSLRESGYSTKIKNQGADGICWAFAITSATESYLLKHNISQTELSPKQMDYLYATGTPHDTYISSIFGEDTHHNLGDGYNFILASAGFSSGLTPVAENSFFDVLKTNDSALANYDSWRNYQDYNQLMMFLGSEVEPYTESMEYSEVTSVKNDYIITEFTYYEASSDVLDIIKQSIYENGAAYVGTVAPGTRNCFDESTKTIVDRGNLTCGAENGHAMTVVGWDDNHQYTDPSDQSTKTGAFILQNSWGESDLLARYNISYDGLVADGMIDPSVLTDEQIQEIKDAIANYDTYETVYLAYDAAGHGGMTDFGLIQEVKANDYDTIYNVAMGDQFEGSAVGDNANEAIYTYSTGTATQYIDSVALSNFDVPFIFDVTFKLSIDNGNGFEDLNGDVVVEKNLLGVQRVVKLSEPIEVSGDFKLKLTAFVGSNAANITEDNLYKYFAISAFAKGNDTPTDDPTDDPVDDPTTDEPTGTITWVQGQDYEIGSGKDLIVKVDYPLDSLTAVTLDDDEMPEDAYTLKSGSTILTIDSDYLDSLVEGKHTIGFLYGDGTVDATFNVLAADDIIPVPNTSATEEKVEAAASTPDTGENTSGADDVSAAFPYLVIAPVAIIIMALSYSLHKRKVQFD